MCLVVVKLLSEMVRSCLFLFSLSGGSAFVGLFGEFKRAVRCTGSSSGVSKTVVSASLGQSGAVKR